MTIFESLGTAIGLLSLFVSSRIHTTEILRLRRRIDALEAMAK